MVTKKKQSAKKENRSAGDVSQEMWCAALSYLFVGLIWFAVDDTMKQNRFVKFHVKQALVLIIIGVLLGIVMGILMPFTLIPFIGILFGLIVAVLGLAHVFIFVLAIIGIVYSFMDKEGELPIVASLAKKLRF